MRFKTCLLFFFIGWASLYGKIGYEEPWGKDADLHIPSQEVLQSNASPFVYLAKKAILFHQNVLSPVDGPRSHFRPSSSEYMLQAMQKHGFIYGFCLGCDRLLRENSAAWVYQTVEENGALYKYNPVP